MDSPFICEHELKDECLLQLEIMRYSDFLISCLVLNYSEWANYFTTSCYIMPAARAYLQIIIVVTVSMGTQHSFPVYNDFCKNNREALSKT